MMICRCPLCHCMYVRQWQDTCRRSAMQLCMLAPHLYYTGVMWCTCLYNAALWCRFSFPQATWPTAWCHLPCLAALCWELFPLTGERVMTTNFGCPVPWWAFIVRCGPVPANYNRCTFFGDACWSFVNHDASQTQCSFSRRTVTRQMIYLPKN